MGIRDTSKFFGSAQADMILADARSGGRGGSGAFIEEMEREGQAQLVTSDRLPARFNSGTQAEFEALGFTFGDPDPDDPMFRPATLPEGWRRKGSDHAMWSYITDQHGRERVSIFYKAAFYDRDAFMNLIGLGWYVQKAVEYDGPAVIFDDEWATPEAIHAAMTEIRDSRLAEAADFRGYAADTARRDEKNRADCAETAGRKEAEAALYEAAMAKLNESG
jgi:hypothetical protein